MELRPQKKKTMDEPVTSLALKGHNLSLGYPNEMIPIPNENRTPRKTD